MFYKLKLLAKDTAIYGIATITARGVNYLLVPIYANTLSVYENGLQGLIYANVGFLVFVYSFGLDVAYMKFLSDAKASQKHSGTFFFGTSSISLLFSSTFLSILLFVFSSDICLLLNIDTKHALFIKLISLVLWLDALASIPFAKLRLESKSIRYGLTKVLTVVINVVFSLVLILHYKIGLLGIIVSNVIASAVGLLSLSDVFFSEKIQFKFKEWKNLIRYGLPLVPNGLAMITIDLIDRNILAHLPETKISSIYPEHSISSEELLGIYTRVYALGMIAQLCIQVFRIGWVPFALLRQHEDYSKKLFSMTFSLSVVAIICVSLGATLFIPSIIKHKFFESFYILPPAYWVGLSFLPILYLSYVFDIVSANLSIGLLITKKNVLLPIAASLGASGTLIFCILLIPKFGMIGAASGSTIGSFIMSLFITLSSLKSYPNDYAWGKLFLVFVGAFTVYIISDIFETNIILNIVLFLVFTVIIFFLFYGKSQSILLKSKRA